MSKATENLPKNDHCAFRDVVKLYEEKCYKRGLKLADQLLARQPTHGETMAMKAMILLALNRKKEAFESARLGVRNDIRSYLCWHVFGTMHKADGNYREACKSFLNSLRIDPDNYLVLKDLASCQAHIGDYAALSETRRLLLVQKPMLSISWAGFAVARFLNQQYAEAASIIDNYFSSQNRQKEMCDSEFAVFRLKCLRKIVENSTSSESRQLALSEFRRAAAASSSIISDVMIIEDLSDFSSSVENVVEDDESVNSAINSGNVMSLFNLDDESISPVLFRLASSRSDYWSRFLIAKLQIYEKSSLALDSIINLIKETPTNLDLYILLSECLWRCHGDGKSSVLALDFCSSLDKSDRYLNSISVKKRLEIAKSSQEIDTALEIASIFVFERHSTIQQYTVELQVNWLELALGDAYLNIGDYEHAYPYYQLVHKFYESLFTDEIFDFHNYVYTRRTTIGMSAYVDLMQARRTMMDHPNHVRSLVGLLTCLYHFHAKPSSSSSSSQEAITTTDDDAVKHDDDDDNDDEVAVVEDLSKKMENLGSKPKVDTAAIKSSLVKLPELPADVNAELTAIFDRLFGSFGLSLVNDSSDVQVNSSSSSSSVPIHLISVLIRLFPSSLSLASFVQPYMDQLPLVYRCHYHQATLSSSSSSSLLIDVTDVQTIKFMQEHLINDENRAEVTSMLMSAWPYGQYWAEIDYYQNHDKEYLFE